VVRQSALLSWQVFGALILGVGMSLCMVILGKNGAGRCCWTCWDCSIINVDSDDKRTEIRKVVFEMAKSKLVAANEKNR